MEILAKCGTDNLLKIFDLDDDEIKTIINHQSNVKEIPSDGIELAISYKISGKVYWHILDKKFLSNLFGNRLIVFNHNYIPINGSIECIECTDLSLIVDKYSQKVSFEARIHNSEVVTSSYESDLESFFKMIGELISDSKNIKL
jgi:hypothetical protein